MSGEGGRIADLPTIWLGRPEDCAKAVEGHRRAKSPQAEFCACSARGMQETE
jgi:hypothetical protein